MKKAGQTELRQYSLEAYINTIALIEGLKRAGKNLNHESLRSALESMNGYDIGGININWSSTSHQGFKEPYLSRIKNGLLTPL